MPGISGTGAMSVTSGVVPGRVRPWPGSGGSCPHRLDGPGRAARLGSCGIPTAGSAGPDRGSPVGLPGVQLCSGRSISVRPDDGARRARCLVSRFGGPADARAAVVPAQRGDRGRPSPASERRPGAVTPRSRAATPRSPGLSRRRCGRAAQATRTRGTRRGIRGGRAPVLRIEDQLRCSARVLASDRAGCGSPTGARER